ncbi:MAG: sugar-binding protein [Verrucomicrobia bacterium]|nr:sugar-binding protein [Verrucomicrobiota bacterium]
MNSRLTLMAVTGMVAVVSMILQAATGPAWWVARGVVNTNATPNDFAAVNQGQLKWMAVNAALELESQLPGGAGSNVWALIESFSNTNNFRPVNLGQLKFVASHFYDRLMAVGYTTNYPWSGQPNDYALANIGQMKNVFSFDAAWWMTLDSDEDGMPDWWEVMNGFDPFNENDADEDADGDGSTNYDEYAAATNPHNSNSMPANNPIKQELDYFNYAQVNLLRALVGLAHLFHRTKGCDGFSI